MLPVWLSKAPWRSAVIVTRISIPVTIERACGEMPELSGISLNDNLPVS